MADSLDELSENLDNLGVKSDNKGWEKWDPEKWREQMDLHPAFRNKPFEPGEELPPEFEALQQLKYDPIENTTIELAQNYKDDGNMNFKLKKYRFAVMSYTEGIKLKADDTTLNSQLLTNRAAANFHLGNYRSAIEDCQRALKLTPDHQKALVRIVLSCFELKKYGDTIKYCDLVLNLNPNDEQIKSIRQKAILGEKVQNKELRKEKLSSSRNEKQQQALIECLQSRNVKFENDLNLAKLEACLPCSSLTPVHQNDQGDLVWPVLILYPEFGISDFIQSVCENSFIHQEIEELLLAEPPPWDHNGFYVKDNIGVFYEDKMGQVLYKISPDACLREVLESSWCTIYGGTPNFIVLASKSPYMDQFLTKYKVKDF